MKNAFYAQSGGVTSVINSSAYGVFSEIKKHPSKINVFASKNGIVGPLRMNYMICKKQKNHLSFC